MPRLYLDHKDLADLLEMKTVTLLGDVRIELDDIVFEKGYPDCADELIEYLRAKQKI